MLRYLIILARQESTPNVKDDDSIPEKPKEQALELKRKIGLFSAISLIVGNMIGTRNHISFTTKQCCLYSFLL